MGADIYLGQRMYYRESYGPNTYLGYMGLSYWLHLVPRLDEKNYMPIEGAEWLLTELREKEARLQDAVMARHHMEETEANEVSVMNEYRKAAARDALEAEGQDMTGEAAAMQKIMAYLTAQGRELAQPKEITDEMVEQTMRYWQGRHRLLTQMLMESIKTGEKLLMSL